MEALSSFVLDLGKEAKNSPALGPFSTKIAASFKDQKSSLENGADSLEDCVRGGKEFLLELASFTKVWEKVKS